MTDKPSERKPAVQSDGALDICVLGAACSTHVMSRAHAFAKRGHRVRLISPMPPSPVLVPYGVDAIWPDFAGFSSTLLKAGLIVWCAWTVLKTRAQVYHVHYAAEIVAWMAWLLRKRPLAVSIMGGDVLFEEQSTLGPLGRWLTRRTVRAADYVTVKTPQLANVVAKFGVPNDRIEVVIWGVDRDVFSFSAPGRKSFRERLGVTADTPIVFSPRMLQSFYSIHLLIEAWPKVLRDLPDAVLALSTYRADPAYRHRLIERAQQLGIQESVVMAPALDQDKMVDAYSAADVVVSIPPSDGFPQAVLEAVACGRPVVLSNLERLHVLLTPDADARYTHTDPASLAAALIDALTNKDASADRASRASEKVKRLADFDENVGRVEARLRDLTARGGR